MTEKVLFFISTLCVIPWHFFYFHSSTTASLAQSNSENNRNFHGVFSTSHRNNFPSSFGIWFCCRRLEIFFFGPLSNIWSKHKHQTKLEFNSSCRNVFFFFLFFTYSFSSFRLWFIWWCENETRKISVENYKLKILCW